MFNRINRINTLTDQLLPIAQQNARFMRERAAQVADKIADLPYCHREEQYINQIERQAVRWSQLLVDGPK